MGTALRFLAWATMIVATVAAMLWWGLPGTIEEEAAALHVASAEAAAMAADPHISPVSVRVYGPAARIADGIPFAIAPPEVRGTWSSVGIEVSWPASRNALIPMENAIAHEYGHESLYLACVRGLGERDGTLLHNALAAYPWCDNSSSAIESSRVRWPQGAAIVDAYDSDRRRHGDYGAQSPNEWYAEGFRHLSLGERRAIGYLSPDPAILGAIAP